MKVKAKYFVPLLTAFYLSMAAILKATSLGIWTKISLISFFNEKMPNPFGGMLSAVITSIAQSTGNVATVSFSPLLDICKISDGRCIAYQSLPAWLQHLYIYGLMVTLVLIPAVLMYALLVEFEIVSIRARQHVLTTASRAELKRSLALTALSFLLPFALASVVISVIFCINQFGSGA